MIRNILSEMTSAGVRRLIMSIICFVFYALCGTAIMLVVLYMIDTIVDGEEINITFFACVLVGLLILKALANTVADISKHYAGFDLVEQIRHKIILKLKSFSLGFYTNERLGEITTIIHKDVDNLEMVVAHLWSRMSADFLVALILGLGLFYLDWRMGLTMTALLPLALYGLFRGIRRGVVAQGKSQDDLVNMLSLFVEYVKGIPVLKIFAGKGLFRNRLDDSIKNFGESSKSSSSLIAINMGKYSFLLEIAFALMATAGAFWVYKGSLSVFNYLMFIIVSKEFYKPFVGMETHWMNYIKVKDSYARIEHLLKAPVVKDPAKPKTSNKFDISFENVGFAYESKGFEIKNLSFTIPEKTTTALVGSSGSGKSTITSLLLRFWEIQSGHIRIGGVDIREMSYDYLLSNISIVMQNVILFSDTIYNNIKLGNKFASKEEIEEAAKKAMIHDFIMDLPEGYDTKIGENGVGLSGGQKQRLSIARAFLKGAPIVILDEITSNVDPINEHKIQLAMSSLIKNRSVLVIAHHLHTIRNADQILVLNKGSLVEKGNHEDLMLLKGLYAEKLHKSYRKAS